MRARIVLTSIFLAVFLLHGCGASDVKVEITDPEAREKYKELLVKNNFEFHVDGDQVIHVRADPQDLDRKMKEYYEWRKATLEERGVVFPGGG